MVAEKQLILIINKQIDADLPESTSMQELQQKLSVFINDLIQNDFQKLIAILYKVDVAENKLKSILRAEVKKDAGDIIADLIIEREKQKIQTRKQFGYKNNTKI